MKELDQIVGHNKRAPLFDKRVLDNPEAQVDVEFPLIGSYF